MANESASLQKDLRLVILSDYIRKEFLDFKANQSIENINKLGVIPIFQYLKRRFVETKEHAFEIKKLAVLTGSLILIHRDKVDELKYEMPLDSFSNKPLSESEFEIITPKSIGKSKTVAAITALFDKGSITTIIGTKSLLGEGWDAPAINTLILASFVGSFVTSNQMRGRAIRVHPNIPEKTANIWHIACLDPTVEDGGADVQILMRRFKAFCGISLDEKSYIENGTDRLHLFDQPLDPEVLNMRMLSLASQRHSLKIRWSDAIAQGSSLVREIKLGYRDEAVHRKKRKFYYTDVVKYSLIELSTALFMVFSELIVNNLKVLFSRGLLFFIYSVGIGLILFFLPKTYKAISLYLQFGRRDKKLRNIGIALKKVMQHKGLLSTNEVNAEVVVENYQGGMLTCFLKNASEKDNILFLNYLMEIIEAVENPRYLLVSSEWMRAQLGFYNYFAVPGVLGDHKKSAQLFAQSWRQYVGQVNLIYTRNIEGRKLLVKARFHYLKEEDKLIVDKNVVWK